MQKSFNLWIRLSKILSDGMDLACDILQLLSFRPMKITAFFQMIILAEWTPTTSGNVDGESRNQM